MPRLRRTPAGSEWRRARSRHWRVAAACRGAETNPGTLPAVPQVRGGPNKGAYVGVVKGLARGRGRLRQQPCTVRGRFSRLLQIFRLPAPGARKASLKARVSVSSSAGGRQQSVAAPHAARRWNLPPCGRFNIQFFCLGSVVEEAAFPNPCLALHLRPFKPALGWCTVQLAVICSLGLSWREGV